MKKKSPSTGSKTCMGSQMRSYMMSSRPNIWQTRGGAKLLSLVLADVHSKWLGMSTNNIRARVLKEKTHPLESLGISESPTTTITTTTTTTTTIKLPKLKVQPYHHCGPQTISISTALSSPHLIGNASR